ncbi:MAG: hypothetical protein WA421_06890, partial [Nitrososphaeraceae archaeon]
MLYLTTSICIPIKEHHLMLLLWIKIKNADDAIDVTLKNVRKIAPQAAEKKGHKITDDDMQMIERNVKDALYAKRTKIQRIIEDKGVDPNKMIKAVDELFSAAVTQAENEGSSHITTGDVTLAFLE